MTNLRPGRVKAACRRARRNDEVVRCQAVPEEGSAWEQYAAPVPGSEMWVLYPTRDGSEVVDRETVTRVMGRRTGFVERVDEGPARLQDRVDREAKNLDRPEPGLDAF